MANSKSRNVKRGTFRACKCGNPSRPGGRYCRECHAAYMREWRKDHPMTEEQRKHDIARSYARQYMLRGKIEREPCVICGDENAEMHHPDYDQPLYVIWVCREHHLAHHRGEIDLPQTNKKAKAA